MDPLSVQANIKSREQKEISQEQAFNNALNHAIDKAVSIAELLKYSPPANFSPPWSVEQKQAVANAISKAAETSGLFKNQSEEGKFTYDEKGFIEFKKTTTARLNSLQKGIERLSEQSQKCDQRIEDVGTKIEETYQMMLASQEAENKELCVIEPPPFNPLNPSSHMALALQECRKTTELVREGVQLCKEEAQQNSALQNQILAQTEEQIAVENQRADINRETRKLYEQHSENLHTIANKKEQIIGIMEKTIAVQNKRIKAVEKTRQIYEATAEESRRATVALRKLGDLYKESADSEREHRKVLEESLSVLQDTNRLMRQAGEDRRKTIENYRLIKEMFAKELPIIEDGIKQLHAKQDRFDALLEENERRQDKELRKVAEAKLQELRAAGVEFKFDDSPEAFLRREKEIEECRQLLAQKKLEAEKEKAKKEEEAVLPAASPVVEKVVEAVVDQAIEKAKPVEPKRADTTWSRSTGWSFWGVIFRNWTLQKRGLLGLFYYLVHRLK